MSKCVFKDNCPLGYLNNRSCSEVLAENEYWNKRVQHMQGIMELAQQKILPLEQDIKKLLEEKQTLEQELSETYRKPFKPNINKDDEEKISIFQ